MNAVLLRLVHEEVQTRGRLYFFDGDKQVFDCVTMELPWKNNGKNISCIPVGIYTVVKHTSPKFGSCLKVLDVPGRSEILFHAGNYNKDTHGCILPGKQFAELNKDMFLDVVFSTATMQTILKIVPEQFTLTITNV